MAHHLLSMSIRVGASRSFKCAVVVERQTRYLEGVVSNGRAGSNPVYRTILYKRYGSSYRVVFLCVIRDRRAVKLVQVEERLIICSYRYIFMERRCSHAGGSQ
jgi:hypothetical protein